MLEVRKESGGNEDADPLEQSIWHPYYVDALVLRDYDEDVDGTSVRHYYAQDANFNVTAVTDDAGSVVERYHYMPYGQLKVLDADFSDDADGASDISNATTFTGRRYDAESGLYYYRNRILHAELGTFITRDPARYTNGQHLYAAYFPPNFVDPFGLAIMRAVCSRTIKRPVPVEPVVGRFYRVTIYMRVVVARPPKTAQTACPNGWSFARWEGLTFDEQKVANACNGDPDCEACLAEIMNNIRNTKFPHDKFGDLVPTGDKCYLWVDNFLEAHYPDYTSSETGEIVCDGIKLEPLEFATRGGKPITTGKNVYIGREKTMTGHAAVKVTIKGDAVFYFDLGSRTDLGNYGGDDFWFPADDELFNDQLNVGGAAKYCPTDQECAFE